MMELKKVQSAKGKPTFRQHAHRLRKEFRQSVYKELRTARNKAARILRHMKMHSTDGTAHNALNRLQRKYGKTVLRKPAPKAKEWKRRA